MSPLAEQREREATAAAALTPQVEQLHAPTHDVPVIEHEVPAPDFSFDR